MIKNVDYRRYSYCYWNSINYDESDVDVRWLQAHRQVTLRNP